MTGSPELSMVLEKAIVLLNGKEFSALRRILAEYEATEINIDMFADSLLQLIKDQERVIFSLLALAKEVLDRWREQWVLIFLSSKLWEISKNTKISN